MTPEQELADLRAAVAHAAAQLEAAEAKDGDAPESARAHFREAVRTIARTLPPSDAKFDRTAVWGELREMDRLHAELAEALDLLRACFTDREATSDERRRFDALMEKHKEKP